MNRLVIDIAVIAACALPVAAARAEYKRQYEVDALNALVLGQDGALALSLDQLVGVSMLLSEPCDQAQWILDRLGKIPTEERDAVNTRIRAHLEGAAGLRAQGAGDCAETIRQLAEATKAASPTPSPPPPSNAPARWPENPGIMGNPAGFFADVQRYKLKAYRAPEVQVGWNEILEKIATENEVRGSRVAESPIRVFVELAQGESGNWYAFVATRVSTFPPPDSRARLFDMKVIDGGANLETVLRRESANWAPENTRDVTIIAWEGLPRVDWLAPALQNKTNVIHVPAGAACIEVPRNFWVSRSRPSYLEKWRARDSSPDGPPLGMGSRIGIGLWKQMWQVELTTPGGAFPITYGP